MKNSNTLNIGLLRTVRFYLGMVGLLPDQSDKTKGELSTLDKSSIRLIHMTIWCLVIIYVIKLGGVLSYFGGAPINMSQISGYTDLSIILLLNLIAYLSYRQQEAKPNRNSFNGTGREAYTTNAMYEVKPQHVTKKTIKQPMVMNTRVNSALITKLDALMKTDKPFTSQDLTIAALAERMNITPRELSLLIKECLGKNFYSFINDYRVEEVKSRLVNPEYRHLSILGIAFECGFSSKSAFHDVFKKTVNLTPKDFIAATLNGRGE
jgi:AraC-like DNA-binding protein